MYKVKICCIGKTKEPWLKHGIEEYTRRLTSILSIQWVFVKNEEQLERTIANEAYIALDPKGKTHTSESFSSFFLETLEIKGSRLIFVIGGAEGLSRSLTQKAFSTVSLSKMTFTHQMIRLLLLEQLYRSFEISRGSGYHK